MIIMRGDFEVTGESKVEELLKLCINDTENNIISIAICCTNVNQVWSYCDGADDITTSCLLYSVIQLNENAYINGLYCSTDSPLGGYWIERGAIKALNPIISGHFGCEDDHIYYDHRNPFLPVRIYAQLAYNYGPTKKDVGKYSLKTVGKVHTIYLAGRPLISITDAAEGLYLNSWSLDDIPNGFPHEKKDIVTKNFIELDYLNTD